MTEPPGYPPGTADYGEPNGEGRAYERGCEESEFGLPIGYEDPSIYHGTTPECEPNVGIGRGM